MQPGARRVMAAAAILGAAAAALGAVGGHAAEFGDEALRRFAVANRYHFYHVLALLLVAVGGERLATVPRRVCVACWLAGTVLFCGSLYAAAFSGREALLPVAPVGGSLLIAGWLSLAVAVFRGTR